MTMDATAIAPRRAPLSVLIPGIGLLGGTAGGLAVGALVVVWSLIESGGVDSAAPAMILGAFCGFVVGGTMGVTATLLRLLAVGLHAGLAAELVAVTLGAVAGPLLLPLARDLGPGVMTVLVIIGALAAWQFCRTVLKRARQEAPEIGPY
jgi:hypothetical protein